MNDKINPRCESEDDREFRCPQCGRVLLRRHEDESVYLGRVTVFSRGEASATCPSCKNSVVVPLRLEG